MLLLPFMFQVLIGLGVMTAQIQPDAPHEPPDSDAVALVSAVTTEPQAVLIGGVAFTLLKMHSLAFPQDRAGR